MWPGRHVPDSGGRSVCRFGAGLLASEYLRHRDFRSALKSSVEALKATGIGILVEFGMVCLAGSVWMIGVTAHFATR